MNGRHVPTPKPVPGPLCGAYAPLLPLLDTRALSREEEASLREHLADCAWCQHQRAAYTTAEAALRRHYASSPAAKPLTLEDIMRASDFDTQPVGPGRPGDRDDLRTYDLHDKVGGNDSGWRGSRPGGRGTGGGGGGRGRPWAAIGAVAAAVLLVGLAAALFAALRPQTPGTPGGNPGQASCGALLPGAQPAAPVAGFPDVTFQAGSVMTPLATSYGGPSQFTILQTDVCYHGTLNIVAPPGQHWSLSQVFPYTGDVLQPCPSQCYQQDNTHYLATEKITSHGNDVYTWHMRFAAPPAAPTCNSNFANSPIKGVQTQVEGVPLPPITYVVPDNAANLHGYDLCSSGNSASVSAFLTKALPASGWAKGNDPHCFYSDECWTKGSQAISWQVQGATDWHIAYHPMAG